MQMELTIRFDYGSIVPWVRRVDGGISAVGGPDSLLLRTPVPLRGEHFHTVAEFVVTDGQRVPFDLTWFPSHESTDAPARSGTGTGADDRLVDRVERPLHRSGPLARRRRPLADHAQGTHLPPLRGDCRRADHVPARGTGRGSQLGLPLLLAA